ncbi:hypothetical protein JW948_18760 [bacterium]|nr:hypothetical protein [bacterium]
MKRLLRMHIGGNGSGKRYGCRFVLPLLRTAPVWIWPAILFCFPLAGAEGPGPDPEISIIQPSRRASMTAESMTFRWVLRPPQDSAAFIPQYYEVMFWSKHRNFSYIRTVYSDDAYRGIFRLNDVKQRFHRHGRYYWQVQAVSEDGRRIESEVRELVVPIPKQMQSMLPAMFPYALQWKQTKRLYSRDFQELISEVYPKIHFQGHTDLCLIFKQPFDGRIHFDLEEQLLMNSSIGLGGEFLTRLRLYENTYFALHPTVSTGFCLYATGLQQYSSMRYQTLLGVDFIINPKGYVSGYARWVPMHRFHYAMKHDGFRTFEGYGWEWGARVVIPRNIMNPFQILGFEMDMERMPIEYTYSRLTDNYTGVVMPTQEVGISFLFQ